jgi:hypothetical protein
LADRKKYAQQALEVYTGARDDIDFWKDKMLWKQK